MSSILQQVQAIEQEMIQLRRKLHQDPELSGQEVHTQATIEHELDRLGIPYRRVGNTSIIASLVGNHSGKTIALRADIDALPIQEETPVTYHSKNPGVMHACGHDAHTAMLLGAATVLNDMKEEIHGEVRFFFQEGEETFSGAKKIIEAGGLEGVDACFGMHGMPELETGFYNIQAGPRMAGMDTIQVHFQGVSGHASMPHLAKDTIHPASAFVIDLQGIVTKNVDAQKPVVLSVGKFEGGTKVNIVAKHTRLEISMRSFDEESRLRVHEAIRRHAQAIAKAYEIEVEVTIEQGAPSVVNDEALALLASAAGAKVMGEGKNISLPRYMGSEDMSYYFQHVKGVYAFMGYRNEAKEAIYFPHHERFNVDEDFLKYGAALHVQVALDFLNSKQ